MGSAGSGSKFIEAHQMWFTFVTARLFHSLSFQPRLAATLLNSCSVANSQTRRMGFSPTLRSVSLAQTACQVVWEPGGAILPATRFVALLFRFTCSSSCQSGHRVAAG